MEIHGQFKIRLINQIMEMTLSEAWNEECAIEAIKQFKTNARNLLPHKWACLIILDNWKLATPDVEPLVLELQKWCTENNQSVEATVLGREIIHAKQYQMDHYLFGMENTIEQKYFSTKDEALKWLKTKGFTYN